MNEQEFDRFIQGSGTVVTFRPQCNFCKHNKDLYSCRKFDIKPNDYMENITKCP